MKASIIPIPVSEREKLVKELFAPEFAGHQLGQPGAWRGVECKTQGLKGRVEETVLDNLLNGKSALGMAHPAGPWRHPENPVGWKCIIETDYRHNALWALGKEEQRGQIELCHFAAVSETLGKVDHALRQAAGYRPGTPVGAIYAAFASGTGEGQVPGLRSTVIIPDGHLRNDGSVMTFPAKVLTACEPRLYAAFLAEFVPRVFYSIGRVGDPGAEVPRNLFQPLAKDPIISGHTLEGHERKFVGPDLFDQWQRQAELRGFGQEKVADLFARARIHAEQFGQPRDIEAPGAVQIIRNLSHMLWDLYINPDRSKARDNHEKKSDMEHGH